MDKGDSWSQIDAQVKQTILDSWDLLRTKWDLM
jgi:hypothetical protein